MESKIMTKQKKQYSSRKASQFNIWRTLFQFLVCKIGYMIRLKLVYRLEVHGLENVPKDNRYIVCPNHLSTLDPPLMVAVMPRSVSFMAKKELFDIPFFEGMFAFNNDDLWEYVKFVEDTMKLSYYRATEQENYKLGTCCRKEGIELVDAHRALTDTRANAYLMLKYIELMRGNVVAEPSASVKKESRFRENFQLV